MKFVNECFTEAGEFVPVEVGDECPICGEIIDQMEAPFIAACRLYPHGKVLTPAARCPNGHLLETAEGHARMLRLRIGGS